MRGNILGMGARLLRTDADANNLNLYDILT